MADSHLKIRDRALILRVLVPGLETRLRDKVGSALSIDSCLRCYLLVSEAVFSTRMDHMIVLF